MFLSRLNPIEPPRYGPVCPVVWEGRCREASPYPDHRRILSVAARSGESLLSILLQTFIIVRCKRWFAFTT